MTEGKHDFSWNDNVFCGEFEDLSHPGMLLYSAPSLCQLLVVFVSFTYFTLSRFSLFSGAVRVIKMISCRDSHGGKRSTVHIYGHDGDPEDTHLGHWGPFLGSIGTNADGNETITVDLSDKAATSHPRSPLVPCGHASSPSPFLSPHLPSVDPPYLQGGPSCLEGVWYSGLEDRGVLHSEPEDTTSFAWYQWNLKKNGEDPMRIPASGICWIRNGGEEIRNDGKPNWPCTSHK
jgi:hypothetical protein